MPHSPVRSPIQTSLPLDTPVLAFAATPPGSRRGLAALGQQLVQAWARGVEPATPLPDLLTVLRMAGITNVSVNEAVAMVAARPAAAPDVEPQSYRRYMIDIARFASRLEATGVNSLAEVTRDLVEAFVFESVLLNGRYSDPKARTMKNRRAAVRRFFAEARGLCLVDHDPTLDLAVPASTASLARPLTDEEVALCRDVSRHTLVETRRPCAWALGEATATTSEIAAVIARDFDAAGRRVWLHGNERKREPRWGGVSDWGFAQITTRIRNLGGDADARLVYRSDGSPESGQAASSSAIHRILIEAGLAGTPGVKPSSLAAWSARGVFNLTGSIDAAARTLGVRSLDQAARMIGWDWTRTDVTH